MLAYQPSFVAPDARVSIREQLQLSALLREAAKHNAPIRVAIIAHRDDLGAITKLWNRPQAYARFLGYELSLGYQGQLLVVMPNGFGLNWPGHPTAPGLRAISTIAINPTGAGMVTAAQQAAQTLDRRLGVTLTPGPVSAPNPGSTGGQQRSIPTITIGAARPAKPSPAPSTGRSDTPILVAVAIIAVLALLGLLLIPRSNRERLTRSLRRPHAPGQPAPDRIGRGPRTRRLAPALVATAAIIVLAVLVVVLHGGSSPSPADALATNPHLDAGQLLPNRPAPDFTLYNQKGQPVSLHQFRGKVTLLDFNDSECTTECPLTTTAMLDAKRMLGPAGDRVQLLGIEANPKATAIDDVLSYTQLHGLTGKWQFLTGGLSQLGKVWRAYGVQADIQRGLISHTPALYVLDTHGRMRRLYITQQSYSSVEQLGQELARESSRLLPGHPPVRSHLSYKPVATIAPTRHVTLPRPGGGQVHLGPGAPHLYVFFDTWNRETTSLAGELDALNQYATTATATGLPPLTAVDEGSVEPTPSALPAFLRTLPAPLRYPVAIDRSGQVADGYQVQGEPWLVLTNATGKIIWYDGIETSRWPTIHQLRSQITAALSAKHSATNVAEQQLIGAPAPLARLHAQASTVVGQEPQLIKRIHALQGYPIVLNVWASWCEPCQKESGLLATASIQYGRQVAFLGADTDATPADGRQFLSQHHVSYPSYSIPETDISKVLSGGIIGLPTTIYINRDGKVTYVKNGPYLASGTLDSDINRVAIDTR